MDAPEQNCGNCETRFVCKNRGDSSGSAGVLFADSPPTVLTEEQEKFKRALYEKMNPRRRKFVDRIGYDQWDPFQAPKDPLDIRTDRTNRTWQELFEQFMRENNGARKDRAWRLGARECALGVVLKDEKYQGIFDFCVWYANLLRLEGQDE